MSKSLSSSQRSPQERKQVLGRYLTRARALQESINSNTVVNLNEVVDKEDIVIEETTLEEKIENQEELILDSEIMTCTSNIIQQCTVSLSKDVNTYDSEEYAKMIHEYIQQMSDTIPDELEDMNWAVLETEVQQYFKKTPHFSTLSGALDPLPKKPIVKRAPLTRDTQVATKRPENVISTENDDQSVEQTVEKIRKLIIRYHKEYHQALDYFRLVLHPKDFGLTIENMLHVAFLVRDGLIQMKKDNITGALMIEPCTKDMIAQAKKSGKSRNIQNIMSLNQNQWRVLVNHYEIHEPMINFNR